MADPNKLFVGNLAVKTSSAVLRQAFSEFGDLLDYKVVVDPVNKVSKGYGFVKFRNLSDATRAVEQMDATVLDDRTLKVEVASERGEFFLNFTSLKWGTNFTC
jgi:RNA recognition motif-containing protein